MSAELKYNLAQNNFHVAPGDVLLLKSSDKGALNRTGQWMKRRSKVQFTHVAVVVDATTIVDAMPKVGVSFRRWREIEDKYDIDASLVVRHKDLASNPQMRELVFQNALYFLKQPYKLRTVLRDTGLIRDQSGLVCSHFVPALLKRLGVKVSRHPVTATLPVDIDVYTRSSSDWRRFSLRESGLFSGATKPKGDDPYWKSAHEEALSQLSEADRAAFERPCFPVSNIVLPINFEDVELADDMLKQAEHHNEQLEYIFRKSTESQYDMSRIAVTFEEKMLALAERLASGDEEAIQISMALLESDGPLGGKLEPITGADFLSRWDRLYCKPVLPAQFLHEEIRAQNQERYLVLLDQSLKRARKLAANHLQMFNDLTNTIERLCKTMETLQDPHESITRAAEAVEELQKSSWFLRGEAIDVVSARVDRISERQKELLGWAKGADMENDLVLRAVETFYEICKYDIDTLFWLSTAEPILTKLLADLTCNGRKPCVSSLKLAHDSTAVLANDKKKEPPDDRRLHLSF